MSKPEGGVGSKGANSREQDFTEYIYPATMHNTMMFFTKKGRCYWLKCYEIPEGAKNSKGRAIQNLLNIESDDSINAFLRLRGLDDPDFINSHYVVFATKKGLIKKTSLEAYSRPRANGVIAINVLEGDEVVGVRLTNGHNELLLADRNGRAVRFNENTVRAMGRVSTGVRGMRLDEGDDEVVGMVVVNKPEEETIMVVSENGYGKRSQVEDYRVTNRGGKGVKTLNITEKTGRLVAIKVVTDENDLMIINKSGILIRLKVSECRVMGRATQGVRLINLTKKNDVNKDKWIGIGGHFEEGESPEECLLREAYEETGLKLTSWKFRGIVTFTQKDYGTEYMCLYTADGFTGEVKDCDEGVLEWVKKDELLNLNLWEGDKIFLKLLKEDAPFFSLKLTYEGDRLTEAVLDGENLQNTL